jgi:phenylpropionate dioxygenase-like ring-hydroxylating dioxygenase large terminal subunit
VTPTLPASWYVDPAHHERERVTVFRRAWLPFAFTHQLAVTGDYVADEVAGHPLLVQRGADGVLRGFHNVCPHRAGPLVWDGAGCASNLVCRYHGWAFSADGALASARDFGGEAPDGIALRPVHVATWRTIVFVHLGERPEPLETWLDGLPEVVAPFPLESYRHHERVVHRLDANWKTYADNYLEGYHLPLVHPGLSRMVDVRRYEVTVSRTRRWHRHTVPAADGAPTAGVWVYVYPHLALNVYPTGMNVERFVPRGPHQVDVTFDYFFADPTHPDAGAATASSAALMAEDRRIVEVVQRNLASGAYGQGPLSPRHEQGVAAFHTLVREALGEPPGDR